MRWLQSEFLGSDDLCDALEWAFEMEEAEREAREQEAQFEADLDCLDVFDVGHDSLFEDEDEDEEDTEREFASEFDAFFDEDF